MAGRIKPPKCEECGEPYGINGLPTTKTVVWFPTCEHHHFRLYISAYEYGSNKLTWYKFDPHDKQPELIQVEDFNER